MFDLKFHTSVLDKMPVGTSFRDSDHEIVKTDEGWKCEDCYSPTPDSSSSAYMSTPSRECALDKFAGAVIDPDDLDPRLLAFLPVGTRVADRDTLDDNHWHWHKTKSGRWVWAESLEKAEESAYLGAGYEDMNANDMFRPFRLYSVGTDEAPERDGTATDPARSYDIDELNLIDNKILLDDDGDRWIRVGNKWCILYSDGISDLPWGDNLNPSYGPYEIAEEFQELTEQQAKTLKGKVLVDREGDLWAFFNDSWHFKSGSMFVRFTRNGSFDSYAPFTLYHDQSVHPESSEPKPEVETEPVKLTSAEATALRDIVYDNGGGKWIYTSEGGYRLVLGGGLLGTLREQLPADYAPYFTEDPRAKSAPEPEPEPEPELKPEPEIKEIPEGKTRFSAAEATNFKDCRFRDRDHDVWVFDEEAERWRFILSDGSLSTILQHVALSAGLEPFTLVEGEIKAESEPEPAEETKLSANEASENKDTVFKDNEGDTWFYDYALQRWRAMGQGWTCAKEELDGFYGPYTKVGPLYEFDRPWTAEEANDLKDEALEDSDGDTWIYDVPSEQWKCIIDGVFDRADLEEAYQPYRIKKAAQRRTVAPGTEEVTLEGSAKEAVELLDRIAKALESIDNKLGDK